MEKPVCEVKLMKLLNHLKLKGKQLTIKVRRKNLRYAAVALCGRR
jgi:hypothetical protein